MVGPEAPLVVGLVDTLRRGGRRYVRPDDGGGADRGLEDVRQGRARGRRRADRATPRRRAPPCVVKVDGLAAGKGVFVCRTQDELDVGLRTALRARRRPRDRGAARGRGGLAVRALRTASTPSPSLPRRTSSGSARATPGPNTGGMGAYSPRARPRRAEVEELLETVHQPVLAELARRDAPFTGLLYAGLMLTEDGPRVLGVQLPVRRSRDAGDPAADRGRPAAAAHGRRNRGARRRRLASRGTRPSRWCLQAATIRRGATAGRRSTVSRTPRRPGRSSSTRAPRATAGRLVTNGGRVLAVTATGDDVGSRGRAPTGGEPDLVRRDALPARTSRSPRPRVMSAADGPLVGTRWSAPSRTASAMQPALDELDSARDPARARGALGAPQPGRGGRVRADGARAWDPRADRRRRAGGGAARRDRRAHRPAGDRRALALAAERAGRARRAALDRCRCRPACPSPRSAWTTRRTPPPCAVRILDS